MSSDAIVSIGGREMSVRDAVNSGQPSLVSAAIAEARFEFIRQNGLYRADRRDFVRYLGTTMISVESSISTSLVQGAIKAQRGENVSIINSPVLMKVPVVLTLLVSNNSSVNVVNRCSLRTLVCLGVKPIGQLLNQ